MIVTQFTENMRIIRMNLFKRILYVIFASLIVIFSHPVNTLAFSGKYDAEFFSKNDIFFYNPESTGVFCTTSAITGENLDYAGREVYNSAEMAQIVANQPFYEQAVSGKSLPWQMLAAMHRRESNLRKYGPANGYGPFQITPSNYKIGDYTDQEFQEAANAAADFMIGKAGGRDLSDPENIKYAFFAYNGMAEVYIQQAKNLGFSDEEAKNGNGSPYVVNKLDDKRDPGTNPANWGQIKRDYGSIEYPANEDYGAFVYYAALAGSAGASSNGCSSTLSGTIREKIVTIAEREYNLYKTGAMNPGSDFTKYTGGAKDQWCAWFASWVYKEAGLQLSSENEGRIAAVYEIQNIGETSSSFEYHANNGSYKPQPGDLAIYGTEHVNIIVNIDGSSIGGNEGGASYSYYDSSSVSKNTGNGYSSTATGYVSPK